MTSAAKNAELERLWRNTHFVLSGAALRDLPRGGKELAFAGRSNAGKSSALNTLTGQKALARTSKTPGRTQLINLFALDEEQLIADLPGYGYAKAPLAVKKQWTQLIEKYFENRDELKGVVLIVDIRRGLTDLDKQLMNWVGQRFLPVHVLLSKADKLKRGPAKQALFKVQKELKELNPLHSAQLFSAPERLGVDEARARMMELLETP